MYSPVTHADICTGALISPQIVVNLLTHNVSDTSKENTHFYASITNDALKIRLSVDGW